ncbi:MAG: response regulator [Glaciecola sp.]|nr:response regulator [Glaciecola sp.]MDG1814921.1 response regulator [Glaciecola sp.]MDG2100185.1 response regulator [Glaciecola sp.]
MEYLTTGDISKQLGVTPRTVIRYIDKGVLKSYKLPGRGNNRVEKKDFIAFCKTNALPLPNETIVIEEALKPPKVLIIDDDINVCKSISRVLQREYIDTIIAQDGFQAGALLHEHKPQIMTLDLNMPGMNGLDILRFTRENPEFMNMKIIIISGTAIENMQQVLIDGADAIIQKPYTNPTLISTVQQLAQGA